MLWLALQQIKSSNPTTRLQAVRDLAKSDRPRAIQAVAEAVKDKDTKVRATATLAVGKVARPEMIEILIPALQDAYPEVRQAAVESLKKHQDDARVRTALIGALRDLDSGVRGRAARALEAQTWRPGNAREEIWFAVARGQLLQAAAHGSAAIESLESVLNSSPYNLQLSAIHALGTISDERVVKPLFSALESADNSVCVAAIQAIGGVGGANAAGALMPMLGHQDHRVRVEAVETLTRLAAPGVPAKLIELLKDSMWDVRLAAASALGKFKDPSTIPALASVLKDSDPDVRETAVFALGQIGDSRAIGPLVLASIDPEASVRRAAAGSLRLIDPRWANSDAARQVAPELRLAVNSGDLSVRYGAQNLLEQIGEPAAASVELDGTGMATVADTKQRRVFAIFLDLLQDANRDLRLAAVVALGRLGDRRALEPLAAAQSDADVSVQRAAAAAVQALNPA